MQWESVTGHSHCGNVNSSEKKIKKEESAEKREGMQSNGTEQQQQLPGFYLLLLYISCCFWQTLHGRLGLRLWLLCIVCFSVIHAETELFLHAAHSSVWVKSSVFLDVVASYFRSSYTTWALYTQSLWYIIIYHRKLFLHFIAGCRDDLYALEKLSSHFVGTEALFSQLESCPLSHFSVWTIR